MWSPILDDWQKNKHHSSKILHVYMEKRAFHLQHKLEVTKRSPVNTIADSTANLKEEIALLGTHKMLQTSF